MENNDFLREIANLLEINLNEITNNLSLKQYMTWDSLAAVSTMGLLDNYFGVQANAEAIDKCETIDDLLNLAKGHQAN